MARDVRCTPLLRLRFALGTGPPVDMRVDNLPVVGRPAGFLELSGTAVPVRLPTCCFAGIGKPNDLGNLW